MNISVIIPIYNRENYLRKCLNSIIAQDIDEYEVILINDGSTDSSKKICQEYTEKYSYFRYVYQEHTGPGGARNTGLAHACGKYIFFLDSDDAIQENCLQRLFSFAEENNADMVYFDEIICDENMTIQSVARTYRKMNIKILKGEALEFSMHPAHVWSRLYRRQLFDKIRFADIWYEDVDIFPRLVEKAERLFYYKVPLYYYRQHKQGITYQEVDERNLDVITAWRNVYSKVGDSEEKRIAIEICIKKSVCQFIFFRPQFAADYADFYNRFFAGKVKVSTEKNCRDMTDIRDMPLWQQADFYGQTVILDILAGLADIYQYGGMLKLYGNKNVGFHNEIVREEAVFFSFNEDIILMEIRTQRKNLMIFEVIKSCSEWNLVSLKNQMKEFKIAEILIEKAMLHGIRLECPK